MSSSNDNTEIELICTQETKDGNITLRCRKKVSEKALVSDSDDFNTMYLQDTATIIGNESNNSKTNVIGLTLVVLLIGGFGYGLAYYISNIFYIIISENRLDLNWWYVILGFLVMLIGMILLIMLGMHFNNAGKHKNKGKPLSTYNKQPIPSNSVPK